MRIRLYTNISRDSLLAEVDCDVRPRVNEYLSREIVLAGAVVGTYSYDMDALKSESKPVIKVCLYSDTLPQVREFAEEVIDGVGYLNAIRTGERFGIMIAHERLGIAAPDFTSPILSIRGDVVGRLAVGGRSASLYRLDHVLESDVLKAADNDFKIRIMPADTNDIKYVKMPDWSLFLELQEKDNGGS